MDSEREIKNRTGGRKRLDLRDPGALVLPESQ
jgi:hypothetical protein